MAASKPDKGREAADDVRRRFKEALDRKNGTQHDADPAEAGHGPSGGSRVQAGGHGPDAAQRVFRRKSG